MGGHPSAEGQPSAGGDPSTGGSGSAGGHPGAAAQAAPPVRSAGRRRAVGIYGTIVTAGLLAAAGDELHTPELTLSIVITLVVYWLAEEYAEILGEHLAGGRLPTWRYALAALAATWTMVGASFLPLLLLLLAWLLGASTSTAANYGLAVAIAELMIYAWAAGRTAQLQRRQQLVLSAATAVLGLVMVVLKDVVLVRLH